MPAKTSSPVKIIIIAIIIILPLVIFSTGFFASSPEKIYPGVIIMGIDLGGLNREEGLAKLTELEYNLRATKVALSYQGWNWTLPLNEVGFAINQDSVITEALSAGKRGSIIKRWQDKKQIQKTGRSLQPAFVFDQEKLAQRIDDLTSQITVDPVEATFKISSGDRISVAPSQNGIDVDLEKLKKDIIEVLHKNRTEVALSLVPVAPSNTTDDLEAMNIIGLLAGYTTNFDAGKVSRSYNISVAARAFDELLVMPGQVVSFNEVVGPRTSEAGYEIAPIIVDDELVDGLGGGICQVSTTLFNSVLLSNLEVEERYNHSIPVSYVSIGRDATVSYGDLDFKFRNNTDNYVFIKTHVSGGQITINIYGNTAYKRDVRIDSWVAEEIAFNVIYENDPNLPKGTQAVKKEGAYGYLAYAERVLVNGNKEISDALFYSSYNAKNKVVAVGIGAVAPKVAPKVPAAPGGQTKPPVKPPEGSAIPAIP